MEKYILKINNENSLNKSYNLTKIEQNKKETILIKEVPFFILEDVLKKISEKRIDKNIEKEIIFYNKVAEKLGNDYIFKLDITGGKTVYFYEKHTDGSLACKSVFEIKKGIDKLENWFVENLFPFYEKNFSENIENWKEKQEYLQEKIDEIDYEIRSYKLDLKVKVKNLLREFKEKN